jgi:DNA-binding response OmpR family regulator
MSAVPIIIVADPDPMVSNALRVEFSRFDCAVLMAATNRELEDYAAQTIAELIVLDVSVRKLSGYAACARIRHRSGYSARPIVLTTGRVLPKDTAAAETAGATLLLAKPYSVIGLVRAVLPHLPVDDPLRAHLPPADGTPQVEWTRQPDPSWRFGAESGLSQNGKILPIVRGGGTKIPLRGRVS